MYSEKIDNIIDQILPITKELRQMNEKMVKDILAIEPGKKFINVMYYTQNGVDAYNFLGIDDNGYGSGLFIGSIDVSGKTPVLNMVDEDGDVFEKRYISDFCTTDLTYIAWMLNGILDVATREGRVVDFDDDDYLV
jgi:hypothetical protein